MTSNQEFKRLARRVKLRRWGMTILIAGVVCLGLGFMTVQTLNALTRKASDRDNAFMSDVAEIMAPNIQISDQYLVNNKLFSGQVLSHRYKDIEGQRVAWSPMTAGYSWAQGGHLPTALNATDEQGARVYDRVTQQKVPVFYNVARKRQAGQLTGSHPLQELGQVERTKGQVAEVALTFQHPLTYRQIQQRLPQGVHAAWYWLGCFGQGGHDRHGQQLRRSAGWRRAGAADSAGLSRVSGRGANGEPSGDRGRLHAERLCPLQVRGAVRPALSSIDHGPLCRGHRNGDQRSPEATGHAKLGGRQRGGGRDSPDDGEVERCH
jgi:hypothetical protein